MPGGEHRIRFLRGAAKQIDHTLLGRDHIAGDEGPYRAQLECALALAAHVVTDARKKTYSVSAKARLGSMRAARRQWRSERELVRFFGDSALKKKQFRAIARRFRKLDERMGDGLRVRVRPNLSGPTGRCGGNRDRTAYVSRIGGRLGLNVCPKWFVIGGTDGVGRQAGILVHEMAHKLGVFGKGHQEEFDGRNEAMFSEAEAFARRHARRARRNPGSYEAYVTWMIDEARIADGIRRRGACRDARLDPPA